MRTADETQSELTDNSEGKDFFQLVFIGCGLGQHCNAHQINANQPMIESLVLRFYLTATNSLTQYCSIYDIYWGIWSCSGLLFFIADGSPIRFTLWTSNLILLWNTHFFLPKFFTYHLKITLLSKSSKRGARIASKYLVINSISLGPSSTVWRGSFSTLSMVWVFTC